MMATSAISCESQEKQVLKTELMPLESKSVASRGPQSPVWAEISPVLTRCDLN